MYRKSIVYYYIIIIAVIVFNQGIISQTIHSGTLIGVWRSPDSLIVIADTKEGILQIPGYSGRSKKIFKINDSTYFTYSGVISDSFNGFDLFKTVGPLFKQVTNVMDGTKLFGDSILSELIRITRIHKEVFKDSTWEPYTEICLVGWENGKTAEGVYTIRFPFYKEITNFDEPKIITSFSNEKSESSAYRSYFVLGLRGYVKDYEIKFFSKHFPTQKEFCKMILYGIEIQPDETGLPVNILTITKEGIKFEEKYNCD